MERPVLTNNLNAAAFRNFYYLKEELTDFCRQEELSTTGNKEILTNRIAHYLETGEKLKPTSKKAAPAKIVETITLDSLIEEPFTCSQVHRQFFRNQIGKSFSFNVSFQNWLKENSGKTYQEAVAAYQEILENKKNTKTKIDRQFEYNTYIRDFFADNQGKTLQDAITCWKWKKAQAGNNRYERKDLTVL